MNYDGLHPFRWTLRTAIYLADFPNKRFATKKEKVGQIAPPESERQGKRSIKVFLVVFRTTNKLFRPSAVSLYKISDMVITQSVAWCSTIS